MRGDHDGVSLFSLTPTLSQREREKGSRSDIHLSLWGRSGAGEITPSCTGFVIPINRLSVGLRLVVG